MTRCAQWFLDKGKPAELQKKELMICARSVHRKEHGLQERFPDGFPREAEGLARLIGHDKLAANDWSLAPGGCVCVLEDEEPDFGRTIRDIHSELDGLKAESVRLAATIRHNFGAPGP